MGARNDIWKNYGGPGLSIEKTKSSICCWQKFRSLFKYHCNKTDITENVKFVKWPIRLQAPVPSDRQLSVFHPPNRLRDRSRFSVCLSLYGCKQNYSSYVWTGFENFSRRTISGQGWHFEARPETKFRSSINTDKNPEKNHGITTLPLKGSVRSTDYHSGFTTQILQ